MTSASVRLVRSEKKTETGRQTSESTDRQQRKSVCHAHTRTRISAWGGGPGGPVKHGQRSRRHQERRYLPPQPGRGNRWSERRSLKKRTKKCWWDWAETGEQAFVRSFVRHSTLPHSGTVQCVHTPTLTNHSESASGRQ